MRVNYGEGRRKVATSPPVPFLGLGYGERAAGVQLPVCRSEELKHEFWKLRGKPGMGYLPFPSFKAIVLSEFRRKKDKSTDNSKTPLCLLLPVLRHSGGLKAEVYFAGL